VNSTKFETWNGCGVWNCSQTENFVRIAQGICPFSQFIPKFCKI